MKKIGVTGCGIIILLFLTVIFNEISLNIKAEETLNLLITKIEDSETEKIKFSIDSFWEHSKNNDGKLYDFLSDYPDSFFEKCLKPKATAKNDENFYADRINGQSSNIAEPLKYLLRDIQENSSKIINYKSFVIGENEAIAYIDYASFYTDKGVTVTKNYKDMGFFVTKGIDNVWRIFTLVPKSVIDNSDDYKNFTKKQNCEK